MKTKFFLSLTVLVAMFWGCKTTQPTMTMQQTPETPSSTATPKPPTRWYQNTYPGIIAGDPINFFNEYTIEVSAKIPKKVLVMQGTTYYVDSGTVINMVVPKLTSGVLTEVKKENGFPTRMKISFDESNPDYTFTFFNYSDKSFVLDANCTVTYEGKKYKTQAFIRGGEKTGLNHLLSNFETIETLNKIESSAGGVNATGTKVIKNE